MAERVTAAERAEVVAPGRAILGGFVGTVLITIVLYACVFYHALPGGPWTKGIIYGILVWIVAMAVVMPMMGVVHPMVKRGQMPDPGFFMANMGATPVIVSLIGHIIYGRR